ncbi:MAG: hypothetical protein H7A53_11340 [Akkermansiaceae bacterium]|nr:hypothetical protein [Akkermansiaceae bacterium]MCP5551473.1 hypothetical protein [Akkermansiaceae bacterium]
MSINESTHEADRALLDAFAAGTLSPEQWRQRNHVAVAFLLLEVYSFEEALDRVRAGIRATNAAHGVVESPTSGYNETTTVALLRIIDTVRRAYAETFPARTADEFCDRHPELMSHHILRLFYTPARRMDPAAKHRFVEPDLAPLPRLE